MAERACYYAGVRLWQYFQTWEVVSTPSTAINLSGLTRLRGYINTTSPNHVSDISVRCVIGPVTAVSGLSVGQTMEAMLLQSQELLVTRGASLNSLSVVEDRARKADVTGGPYPQGGQVISHGTAGGSWVPTAGRLVLVRNPATGDGFTTTITATGTGTVTLTVPSGVTVNSAWDILDCQVYIPSCAYRGRTPGSAGLAIDDAFRRDIEYRFTSVSAPIYASAHNLDLDES